MVIDEQLLGAGKTDNEDMLLAVLEQKGSFEINHQDGYDHFFWNRWSGFRPSVL
jgi:hypothetical protein